MVPSFSLLGWVGLTLLLRECRGSFLCSVCNSIAHPLCQTKPPSSQICWSPGDGVTASCSIVKIFKQNTRILLEFRRDCSTADQNVCYNPPARNITICTELCFTSGCNSGTSTAATSSFSAVSVGIVAAVSAAELYNNWRSFVNMS